MRKKHILMITLSLILLLQPLLSNDVITAQTDQFEVDSPTEISINTSVKQTIGVGGEEQIMTDFNPNYGFEYTDYNNGPGDYNYYGSAFQYTDETYTSITHSGTYACRISGQGNIQSYANPYLYRGLDTVPYVYLDENIEMNFWYYLISNPDLLTEGSIYLRLSIYTPSGNRNLFYYFSDFSIPSNGSTSGNYDLTGSSPFSVWNHFQRDLTSDFTAIFGAPTPTTYLQYMYFYGQSPADATGLVQWVIDDVSITNGVAYEWLTDNGGFEDGDGSNWSGYNRGTANVFLADDHTEGTKSANLTATSEIAEVTAESYVESDIGRWDTPPLGLYAHQPGDFFVNFDWKYNERNPGTSNYAFFGIYGYNSTFDFGFYWYLGEDSDVVPDYNVTTATYSYTYFGVPGFGSRGVWNTFSIDIYDYLVDNNITDMPITSCGFRVYASETAGATTELLVDNYHVIADPLGDPGFEEDWYYTPANPIPSWEANSNEDYISFTSNSHSGDNAANISSYDSAGQVRIYRDTYVPVENNLFSDIWWNLDTLDFDSNSYAQIYFELDYSYYLNYLFATGNTFSTTNTSNSYYYYAENHNELDTWNLFDRNLAEDIITSFGEDNWNITEVRISVYGSGVEMNSLLVDDIHFVRDTIGPQLVSQNILNTPTYYQDAIVDLLVYDVLTRAVYVEVFYYDGHTWEVEVASPVGSHHQATIPAHAWGTTIEYTVVMQDVYGTYSTDDNSGLYYSYNIVDDIDPTVQILHVTTSPKGIQSVEVEAFDLGSDIAFVELFDTDVLVGNLTTGPFNYIYSDGFEQVDGLRTLVARAVDNAGNEMTYEMALGVDLPSGFISFFQTWGTLVGAAIVGTAWITVIIVKFFKKPKT